MRQKTGRAALIIAGLSTVLSCQPGTPDVEKQFQDSVPVTETPSLGQSLGLSGEEKETIFFEGPLLIWNDNVSPESMAALLAEKEQIIRSELSYKSDILPFDALVRRSEELRIKREELSQGSDLMLTEKKSQTALENTYKFGDKILERIRNSKEKQKSFQQFCLAWFWRFASSDMVRHFSFASPPEIMPLCHAEYKELLTAEECQKEAPHNWQACFWGDSGIRSMAFHYYKLDSSRHLSELGPDERESLFQYFSTEEWLSQLGDDHSSLGRFSLIKVPELGSVLVSTEALRSRSEAAQKSIGAVLRSSHFPFHETEAERQALSELIKESSRSAPGFSYRCNTIDLMHNLIKLRLPENADARESLSPQEMEQLSQSAEKNPEYSQLFAYISKKELEDIRNHVLIPSEAMKKERLELENIISGAEIRSQDKRLNWLRDRLRATQTLLGREMVEALWPYAEMKVVLNGDHTAAFLFRPDHSWTGSRIYGKACLDLRTNQEERCNSYENHEIPMGLSVDHNSGQYVFNLEPDITADFYPRPFDPAPEPEQRLRLADHDPRFILKTPFYQSARLSQSFLAGHRFRLEVYPHLWHNRLPGLTGKVFIYDSGGRKLFDGETGLTRLDLAYARTL